MIAGTEEIVYYLESRTIDAQVLHFPPGFTVSRYDRSAEIPSAVREAFYLQHGGIMRVEPYIARFFRNGGRFWVAEEDGCVVGSVWSFRGGIRGRTEIPVTESDIFLVASEVFPEHRGKRFNVFMMNWLVRDLVRSGARRFYLAVEERNTAQVRSLSRSLFRPFCRVRRVFLPWRTVSIWAPFPEVPGPREERMPVPAMPEPAPEPEGRDLNLYILNWEKDLEL
jgi:GNAT superfamily N-acetyltransferase